MVNIPPVGGLIATQHEPSEGRVVPKMNADAVVGVQGDGGKAQHWAALMTWESETCFLSFTYCFLSERKSVIHLQVESGTLMWESLSSSTDKQESMCWRMKCRARLTTLSLSLPWLRRQIARGPCVGPWWILVGAQRSLIIKTCSLVFGRTGTMMEFLKQAGTTIKHAPFLMQLLSRKVCNMLCKPWLCIKRKGQPMQPQKKQKKKDHNSVMKCVMSR